MKEAQRKGGRIKRREGSEFEIAPVRSQASPLDIQGVDLGLSAEEIVSVVREMHAREGSELRSGAPPLIAVLPQVRSDDLAEPTSE